MPARTKHEAIGGLWLAQETRFLSLLVQGVRIHQQPCAGNFAAKVIKEIQEPRRPIESEPCAQAATVSTAGG